MAVVYRLSLHSFDERPKKKDLDRLGQITCVQKDGKIHGMNYTEEYGWNTHYLPFDDSTPWGKENAMAIVEMKEYYRGWLRLYEIGEENWYDQTVTMLEEVQGLQREYEGEQRNDDKSDALDELADRLDQAKDFAEVFS